MRLSKTRKAEPAPKLRVKNEPPTMEEAMLAASCMSDDVSQQIEIAASLLGLPLDAQTIKNLNAARPRGNVVDISVRGGPQRSVVVEKKRVIARPLDRPVTAPTRSVTGQLRLNRA
jgi:hypothetical protein